VVFLQSHGVSTLLAVKIFKQYGNRAIAVVKENPYRLALDIYGIGFKTADKIAGNLGMSTTSPRRAEAGVLHVVGELADEGHVFYPRDRLVTSAGEILQIDAAVIEQAITDLSASERLVIEALGEGAEVCSSSPFTRPRQARRRCCASSLGRSPPRAASTRALSCRCTRSTTSCCSATCSTRASRAAGRW
jgi:ATP-dependent exoDNAse (exonuclease V) alpha subunit